MNETSNFTLEDYVRILNQYQEIQLENHQLKDRIEKAIDLIEKSVTSDVGIDSNGNIIKYHQLNEDETGELLEILKGEENNNLPNSK